MKFVLSMIMCSSVFQNCLPPHSMPDLYNSHYECMIAGHEKSISKMKEIGKRITNRDELYFKFACYEVEDPGEDT